MPFIEINSINRVRPEKSGVCANNVNAYQFSCPDS